MVQFAARFSNARKPQPYDANSGGFQAFENTSTNIAAAQMRNELTKLAETVKDPKQKQASHDRHRHRQRRPQLTGCTAV